MTLGVLLIACAASVNAADWVHYPSLSAPARAAMVVGDFDGDGRHEAVLSGLASARQGDPETTLLGVLGGQADALRLRSVTPLAEAFRHGSAARGQAADGTSFVVTLSAFDTGHVEVFAGVPLHRVHTVEVPGLTRVEAVATLDGVHKIVGLMRESDPPLATYPAVIDLASGAVEWMGTAPAVTVAVAALGSDGAPKLVIGGTPGLVLDASTRALEWTWAPGFGSEIVVGDFGPGGTPGFAIRNNYEDFRSRVDIFRGQPYARIRSLERPDTLERIVTVPQPGAVGDFIGLAERVPGEPDRGELSSYLPATGQLARTLSLGCGTPVALAVGAIDASGEPRLVYAGSRGPRLCVADLTTGTPLYESIGENGPFAAVARGDVGGAGNEEVVAVGRTSVESSYGPTLRVLDGATGEVLRSVRSDYGSGSYTLPFIALAQLDADSQLEVIVAQGGSAMGEWWIEVRDGLTLQQEWERTRIDQGFPTALSTADVNADGVTDVLVLSDRARLVVLDGRDGTELWRSIALPASPAGGLASFDRAGTPQVAVGVAQGVYLIDLAARTFTANLAVDGAVIGVRKWQGPGGCRIGVITAAPRLSVHACDTLAPLAEYPLPLMPTAFWPLGNTDGHFLLAGEGKLHELRPDGVLATMPRVLGNQLAEGNQGSVRLLADGSQVDALIGSDYLVARLRLGLDDLFTGNFEVQP
ncbi:hypothetical protein [Dokdonella sp.]|uniref:hypothetical protein n=1 Tax=Dokdonella sp. TaxID=2291710 RepID=UPI0031CC0F4A|nr:hypothetical protein [Dokdonella sp.]